MRLLAFPGPAVVVAAALVGVSANVVAADTGTVAVPAEVVLAAPAPDVVAPLRVRAPLPAGEQDHDTYVLATDFDARVFASSRRDTWGLGAIRRGTILPGETRSSSRGCPGGQWVELEAGGLVCTNDGVTLLESPETPDRLTLAPDLSAPLPYRYAKVTVLGAPRFGRLPTVQEERAVDDGKSVEGLGVTRTEGIYFMAVDRPVERDGQVFWRSVEGQLVREEDLALVRTPRMRGEALSGPMLPLAFLHLADAPAFELGDGKAHPIGMAEHRARFVVASEARVENQSFVLSSDGLALRREDVRVARRIDRPSGVGTDERWIHVDLDEQTLVAYEGDLPVYATLVATGQPGYDTPDGLYRVRRKYVSRRMRGPDPDHGTYDIEEVPWVMYYHGGFALHGAYWHDEFGKTRSHGCTNVPPADARWLFLWSAPEIPRGWHGTHEAGTHVWFTRAGH